MRVGPVLFVLLLVPLSGCLQDEPVPGPQAATGLALLPPDHVLGEPAEWGAALGQGRHEVQGTPRLLLAFGVETEHVAASRLVDGLYNMREHVRPDTAPGDGAAPNWLYQHRDDTDVTMQRVVAADGSGDGAAWGAMWDWSYWGLASVERPVDPDGLLDSDGAAEVAAGALDGWGDPAYDHLYLLYVPENETAPHWLLGLWSQDGTERRHVVVRATDGTSRTLDEVHPQTAERGQSTGDLVEGVQTEARYHVEPAPTRDRLVVRVTPELPDPVTGVDLEVDAEGWEKVDAQRHADGTVVNVLRSLGGGPADVTVTVRGPAERYTLDWCTDGRFNDILGRTPEVCDDLLS